MIGSARRAPKTTDLVERMFFLKLALPIWAMLFFLSRILFRTGELDRVTLLVLTWIVTPALAFLVAGLLSALFSGISRAVIGGLHSSGGEAHSREYSEQQALVAFGRIEEAVDSYSAHLVAFPEDVEARLRLAALLADAAGLPDRAEALYHEARALPHSPRQALVISNALIDLHRKRGQHHALRAELARFARTHHGTQAGEHARQELRQLVEDDHRVS
jgi:hypothetical protein